MIKQYNNRASYRVTLKNHYIVIISFDHFTNNGNAVYDAEIINLDRFQDVWSGAYHYRFLGHQIGEQAEARWIAQHHEEKDEVMRGCRA